MRTIYTYYLSLSFAIISSISLFSCRQGLNDNEIDPDAITHAKALVDFYSLDCSIFLKVCQYQSKTHWLYCYTANWNNYFTDAEIPPHLPSDLIKYKDKYILFFIGGKKELDERMIHKALNISTIDNLPDEPVGYEERRVWTYLKNKKTGEGIFVQSEYGIPLQKVLGINPADFNFFRFNE